MDELKVEIALEIIQRKIVSLLKSNKDIDVDTAKETLKTLVEEREKIYNLDEETIEKVYNIYLDEVKKGK
jgi:predicted HTH domain antitoxin